MRAVFGVGRVPARRRAARRDPVGVGRARDPGRRAVRGRVLRAARARSRSTQDTDLVVPGDHAARHPAAVLVLGHVLPDLAAAAVACSRSRCSRRCGTASSSPARDDRARSHRRRRRARRGARRVHRRRLAVGDRHASAEAGGVSVHARPPAHRARRRVCSRDHGASGRGGSSSATCSRTGACGTIFLSGFVEPVLFLLSIGIGVGELVGDLPVGGTVVDYKTFVAPGLLAIGRDERRAARHDVQLLREVQVLAHLRRGARDAARHRATSRPARSRGR